MDVADKSLSRLVTSLWSKARALDLVYIVHFVYFVHMGKSDKFTA